MPADPPPVHVIGMGDDGPAGLGAEARALLAHADLVCGGHRHLGLLSGGAKAGARLMPITADLDGLVAAIENARQEGGCAVVLASGDPLFFGIGEALGRRLGREALHVLPAPSSVQLAFARIGLSWQDAEVLSAHGRPLGRILGRAMAATKMAVLTDETNTPAAVARALLNGGMEDARAAVGEHLGGPRERVTRGVLSEIAGREFARLNVLIVEREPAMVRWGRPLVGQPESAYAHARAA
ncbi:MAG: precorrin-6y C5,15-methyltransferase (decarboxylating) subunit CbiE [Dehalococcoidia bacterium]